MSSTAAQTEFASLTATGPRTRTTSSTRNSSDDSEAGSASSRASTSRSSSVSPAMPSVGYRIPAMHVDANTGPKGVIADAQSFDRARKRSFRQTLYGLSNVLSSNVLSISEKASSNGRRRGSDRSTSDNSEDEDGFMRSWREKRMLELQSQGREIRTRRLSPSKRSWGHVVSVDPIGYLDAIEKVSKDTIVVVLIHDDESLVSGVVEDALSTLARKHEFTRFIKLNYQDAEMNPVAIPAILAYKAGELIANLVSVVDEIPPGRNMSTSSLELVLKQHKVLL